MKKRLLGTGGNRYPATYKYELYNKAGEPYEWWMARINWPKDPKTGYQRPPSEVWRKTLREAVEARAVKLKEVQTAKVAAEVQRSRETFAEYLENKYIPMLKRQIEDGDLTAAYVGGKIGRFNNFFLTGAKYEGVKKLALRNLPIGQVQPEHVAEFFNGLKFKRVSKDLRVGLKNDWSQLLDEAEDLLPHSPKAYWRFNEKAKLSQKIVSPKRSQKKTWDLDLILKAQENPQVPPMYRAAVGLMMWCLRRPSELFALDWEDVNFADNTVTFSKTLREGPQGGTVVGPVKTALLARDSKPEDHIRVIECPRHVIDALRDLKGQRKGGPVFLNSKGNRMTVDVWPKYWKVGRAAMGLPDGPEFYSLKDSGNLWQDVRLHISLAVRVWKAGHANEKMLMRNYNATDAAAAALAARAFDASKHEGMSPPVWGNGMGKDRLTA